MMLKMKKIIYRLFTGSHSHSSQQFYRWQMTKNKKEENKKKKKKKGEEKKK